MLNKKAKEPYDQLLLDRTALVSGGASGIGKAIAKLFANEGANVLIFDIDEDKGEAAVREINENGGKSLFISGDVSNSADCKRSVESAIRNFGTLDILVNNAGIVRRSSVLETEEDDWDRVMDVNVKSVFLLCKNAIPVMKKTGKGVIVNIASGWGLAGGKNAAVYCASKGAVVLLTKAMSLDHGEDNIRINCICPGDTDTQMLHDEANQLDTPVKEFLVGSVHRPLKRIGKPEDIAKTALFLVSDSSSFITGASYVVDGGGLAGNLD